MRLCIRRRPIPTSSTGETTRAILLRFLFRNQRRFSHFHLRDALLAREGALLRTGVVFPLGLWCARHPHDCCTR